MEKREVEQMVNEVLNDIRPFLQSDGGDVSLVEVNNNNEVVIQLLGACGVCPMSMQTFKIGIEDSIKRNIPNVTKIIALDANMNNMFPDM